jgi:hypothetical protein
MRARLILAAVLCGGCSLLLDAGSLDEGCQDGEKACDGVCVSTQDPTHGCARETCAPCILDQAETTCDADGQCAVGSCLGSYADCDTTADNGCETNLDTDADNCGRCDRDCDELFPARPHVAATDCAMRNCVVGSCQPDYLDCNNSLGDGCEVDRLTDEAHCGTCDTTCGVTQTCSEGTCL